MTIINQIWPNTPIISLLKTRFPLIQAPMAGGATTPELVAAVSNAGGLGSLGAGYLSAEDLRTTIKKIRELTTQAFAVNLFIPEKHTATEAKIEQARQAVQACCSELNFKVDSIEAPYAPDFEKQMQVILEEKIPALSFAFGTLSQTWIKTCKKSGMVLMGTATNLEEAKLLESQNIDAIVVQGSEAGGHRGTFLGKAEDSLMNLSDLLILLKEQISTPLIAAGGIMDAKKIVKMLKLGASAVQMGTAFLSCTESGIHRAYKKLLLNSSEDITTLTRAYSGKLVRGINNKFISRMQTHQTEILDYPIQNILTTPMRRKAAKQGNTDFMSMWAGQAAYLCRDISAAELIKELDEAVIRNMLSL